LAYNKLLGFYSNSSDLTHVNGVVMGWLQTTCHQQNNKRVPKQLEARVDSERWHYYTCCNIWYRKTFYYSDRNTVCL